MAYIVEKKCGETDFLIKIDNSDLVSLTYQLYYKINEKEKKLFYIPSSEHLSVACIQSNTNHRFLLMEEMCGGSVCTDAGVYALFDPTTKKMLVKYNPMPLNNDSDIDDDPGQVEFKVRLYELEQKNHQQIAKFLGYEPPYLPRSKAQFCCKEN